MRVRFRTYCYGCRQGARWYGKCLWRTHRYDWDYYIHCDGRRLIQRQGFHSFRAAYESAQRSWFKLTGTSCIQVGAA